MQRLITSKNMGGVSELTLVADVRPELVEIRSTMTHATRLRILLRTLYGIRRAAVEEGVGPRVPGPLESLEFLHFVRFALLDNDTKFLLSVTFDGSWEPYIRAIAEKAGPLLDVIFCHTVGYNALSSDKGFEKFGAFARDRQVEADFWFADSPGTTAKDVALLKDFHRRLSGGGEAPIDPMRVGAERVERGLKALHQLYDLDPSFPAEQEKAFLRRTAKMILDPIMTSLRGYLDHLGGLGYDQNDPHEAAYQWVAEAPIVRRPAGADLSRPAVVPSVAQGNIVAPYAGMTHGATLLLRIEDRDRARGFLRRLAEAEVTREDGAPRTSTLNVGLTFEGLRRLGVPEDELEQLPQEFREGMAARAGWLGDLGPNHPSHWSLPEVNWGAGDREDAVAVRMSSVDVVLQLQAKLEGHADAPGAGRAFDDSHPLHDEIARRFGDPGETGCQLMRVEPTAHLGTRSAGGHTWGLEHFGYLDGVSQPRVDGAGPERDRVALGELLIGHPDDRDGVAARASVPWLEHGSFQVVRKLRQDVAAFAALIERHRAEVPDLAERMMGKPLADLERYGLEAPGGANRDPLLEAETSAEVEALVDFAYPDDATDDDAGVARDSHVRRSNPRNGPDGDARVRATGVRAVPRIARRGMPYGVAWDPEATDDDGDRGLLFTCFNASLADQFEVIQRWVSGANASGLVGMRNDPFLGVPEPGYKKTFTVHRENEAPVHIELPTEPLVSLEWGLYLFMPSVEALARLTEPSPAGALQRDLATDADVRAGEEIIGQMELLHRVEQARDPERAYFVMQQRWKALIEDLSRRETMRQVWAAIRARGGALETPYGVLVGSRELIGQIFADRRDYSVSEYWNRMRDSIGELYLGMDPEPQTMADHANPVARIVQDRYLAAVGEGRYARESAIANAWIAAVSEEQAYSLAYGVARGVITGALDATRPVEGVPRVLPHETVVNVRDLVDYTVGTMCTPWFGLPDPEMEYQVARTPAPKTAHNPDNFKSTARYIFSPNPTEFVQRDGRQKGTELLENARAWVKRFLDPATDEQGAPVPPPSPPLGLFGTLLEKRDEMIAEGIAAEDFPDVCARVIVGTIHGFVGPVGGTATSLLHQWTENRELWRQQQALLRTYYDPARALSWQEARDVLLASVEEGMRLQPFPYVLHRTPVRDVVLRQKPRPRDRRDGAAPLEWDLAVEAGSRVVLGLVSGAHDSKAPDDGAMSTRDMLFGGIYGGAGYGAAPNDPGACGDRNPRAIGAHACPGQAIGMGTVLGVLTALLQAGNLRRLAPLKLELAPFGYLRYAHPAAAPDGASNGTSTD